MLFFFILYNLVLSVGCAWTRKRFGFAISLICRYFFRCLHVFPGKGCAPSLTGSAPLCAMIDMCVRGTECSAHHSKGRKQIFYSPSSCSTTCWCLIQAAQAKKVTSMTSRMLQISGANLMFQFQQFHTHTPRFILKLRFQRLVILVNALQENLIKSYSVMIFM